MRNLHEIIELLAQRDIEALNSIYEHRCLTQAQLYEMHYMESFRNGKIVADTFCKKKVKEFLSLELIKKVKYLENEVYFLTPMGIEVIRYCYDLPTNIYDSQKRVVKRGYYTAKELEIFPKNIHHQVNLNQFMLEFRRLNLDVTWKYFDEKYVSQYTNIRPDGMITLLDTDFFLEMDMSTESKKQLFEKWENYRNFINSREYSYKERRIIVLFIVEGALKDSEKSEERISEKVSERIKIVKYTFYERLLDLIDADFDIYVGSKEELLNLLVKKLIPSAKGQNSYDTRIKSILYQKHGFSVANGDILKNTLNGAEYGLYIRKVNENNNIIIENNRIQEFLFDEYFFCPASVLSKISYHDKNNTFFRGKFNREINFIVLGESVEQIYSDLKIVDLIGTRNIYFTTLDRLETLPFYEAIFQFDFLGNVHRFTNSGLNERVFERNMREY